MKKCAWLAGLLGAAILGSTAVQADVLTWNELNDEAYGATVGAHAFAEKLEELSGGTLTIDLYINGMLGSEAESMQGLQLGTLDIFRGNAASLADYGSTLISATGMPYIFSDMEEFAEVANSDLGQELLDSVEEADAGFIALAWLVEGPRQIFLTEKTWEHLGKPDTMTLSLMEGLNIRVPGYETFENTISALGANPIPITYSELKESLAAGNIDGAENGVTSYMSEGFYEVAPYFVTDAHIFGCGVILVSSDTWNRLTEEQKDWMREAGREARDACYAYNFSQEEACFDRFGEAGVHVLAVEDPENWQEACADVYEAQSEEVRDVIRRIQNHEYD